MVRRLSMWTILAGFAILFMFVLPLFGRAVGILTDFLWFREIHLTNVFKTTIITKIGLGFGAGILAWLVIYGNIILAKRLSRRRSFLFVEHGGIQLSTILPFSKYLFLFGSLFFAYMIGNWAATRWETLLWSLNAVPFGAKDPLFGKDIAYYVFSLPFLRFIYNFAVTTIVLSALSSFVVYFFQQNIGVENNRLSITTAARKHLLILAGLLALSFYFLFQFKLYDQLNAGSSIVSGAGYANIRIYLPYLKMMKVVSLLAAVLIFMNIRAPRYRLTILALVLLFGGNILGSSITGLFQRFVVAPNEVSKEREFIKWTIQNTRAAFNLDKIDEIQFSPQENLTPDLLKKNYLSVENIRLWDHAPLLRTFSQLQEIRTYYEFLDVDNDRYTIDGQYRQVMLSPRELVPASLPSRIWINEHLSYTHGYGLCLGPVNKITPEGLPEFFIRDIPPVSSIGITVNRPEIYYGEAAAKYAIVNTANKEFDYPSGEENVYATYVGTGGIKMGGFLKKLLFVLRYKELKILLSSDITSESRILMHREISERARRAMPFVSYDSDPYMIITDQGRLKWLLDGYTVTNKYPYAAQMRGIGNYMRNSVKVVIDAYDGSIDYYVADESDPLIRAYAKIFPNAFASLAQMPEDIRRHLRYPAAYFSIQANMYATYHMTDPQVFYNKEDLWKIPEQGPNAKTMQPYYTITKLAGIGEEEEFILMVPFSPAKKENMIAWLAARCDGPNYGKLIVFNFPKQKLVYGPKQIESRIDQNPEISQQLTLWNQGGSNVIRGSLLVIPVEQSLLYVEPLYIAADDGGVPELKRVIVAYGNHIVMESNLQEALSKIFNAAYVSPQGEMQKTAAPPSDAQPNIENQIKQANDAFESAQRALTSHDWQEYGRHMKEVERLLREMAKASKGNK